MPKMDGVETIRKLQDDPQLDKVPTIIMVTAYGKEELAERAKDIDHLSFLTKPTNASYLFDTIMSAFGREMASNSRRIERQEDFSASIKRLRGANILLVEDNEINQELALELLGSNGIYATLAENGQQAVDKIQQQDFDGVLMDIQMPIMDGYSATKIIRKLEIGKKLPIIAMTANAMSTDIEQAQQAGMNDHISKPINVAEMFCTMANWITPASPTSHSEDTKASALQTRNQSELDLPQLTGINSDAGLAITQGNKKLYRRLLIKFLESEQNFSEKFQQAQASDDADAATRVAHTLKGVAGNIGAHDIQKAAQALELACNEKLEQQQIETLLNTVTATLTPALESLKTLESEQASASTAQVSPEQLIPLYEKLLALLLEDDADAVDVLEEIIELIAGTTEAGQLKQLEKQIEQYEYDGAIEIAKTMLAKLS